MKRSGSFSVDKAILIVIIVLGVLAVCTWIAVLVGIQMKNQATPIFQSTPATGLTLEATHNPLAGSEQAPTDLPVGTLPVFNSPAPTLQPSVIDIEALLAQMSLEQKVGQMIMSGVSGKTLDGADRALIKEYYVGGIVYFGDNTAAPGQTLRLSQELQQLAAENQPAIPLLIAVDHEGGIVFRFKAGLTHFPNAMTMGAANSTDLTYQVAARSALELRAVGINMSLGPVLDINDVAINPVIGLRAFGGTPEIVATMGERYIAGLQDNYVIATGKHFPGHGSTDVDSHSGLPIINKTIDQLWDNELVPFMEAARAGVGVIMVGHIANLAIDPSGRPASLSPQLNQDLLRKELGYKGVVMTDAMSMGAITAVYDLNTAAVMAVQAGCDILAYPSANDAASAHGAIVQAVRTGLISSPERIDESVRRILALKARVGLFDNPIPGGEDIEEGAGQALARQLSQRAIYQGGESAYPLLATANVLLVSPDRLPQGSDRGDNLTWLGELLRARGVTVDEWIYSVDDPGQTSAIQSQVMGVIDSYASAIVVTWDAKLRLASQGDASQKNLLKVVLSSKTPTIVVAASSPYDLEFVPASQPALAIFGGLEVQIEALVEALLAGTRPPGIMPVVLKQ